MRSNRPYIVRALYEWILDNDCTPYILVDDEIPGISVPPQYIQDGRIVLDVSPTAVRKLLLSNAAVEFDARFNEAVFHIYVPMKAVLAIYAHEDGEGTIFDQDDPGEFEGDDHNPDPRPTGRVKGKPHLKVVK